MTKASFVDGRVCKRSILEIEINRLANTRTVVLGMSTEFAIMKKTNRN